MLYTLPVTRLQGRRRAGAPLLGALDTITLRERQLPTYAVAVIVMTGHSPSRSSREIRLRTVILGARQHL